MYCQHCPVKFFWVCQVPVEDTLREVRIVQGADISGLDEGACLAVKNNGKPCAGKHVRTSPFYPQSNGKLERFHKSIKEECIRPGTPLSLDDARRIVGKYIEHYNTVRLHSSIGYIAPADKLAGRDTEIFKERDRKLEEAREQRKLKRQKATLAPDYQEATAIPLTGTA